MIVQNTRSGLLTLHSLVPERFFKVLKDLTLNHGNCGQVCPQTVRGFIIPGLLNFYKNRRQSGRARQTVLHWQLYNLTK